jgi:ubiquinone/menaquinone biosynthesis C-methylase UbiE
LRDLRKRALEMNEQHWKLVRNHFSQETVIARYRDRVKEGLRPWEGEVCRQYHVPPGRILDIGCGCGREAVALARLGYRVTGVDIMPEMLRVAETVVAEADISVDFHLSDGKTLDFPDETFDHVIVWSQTLGYVPGVQNRVHLLRECARVLRRDGRLSFSVHDREPTEKSARERGLIKADSSSGLEDGDFIAEDAPETYFHFYRRSEVLDLCAASDLRVIVCQSASEFNDPARKIIWVCVCEKVHRP